LRNPQAGINFDPGGYALPKYTQCPERQQRKSRCCVQVSYHITNSGKMEKVEVSVARYLRTPPHGANREDFRAEFPHRH